VFPRISISSARSSNIDLVSFDNYMPLSDWTTGSGGLDAEKWLVPAPTGTWPPDPSDEWRDPFPHTHIPESDTMKRAIFGLFDRGNLLDIIRYFIVFEIEEGKPVKKIARIVSRRVV